MAWIRPLLIHPLFIGLVLLTAMSLGLLGWMQILEQDRLLHRQAQLLASEIATRLATFADSRLRVMAHLADRWPTTAAATSRTGFRRTVAETRGNYPIFQAVLWFDRDGARRWLAPEEETLPQAFDARITSRVNEIRQAPQHRIDGPREYMRRGPVLLIFQPVWHGRSLQGVLVGLLRVADLIQVALRAGPWQTFSLAVEADGRLLHRFSLKGERPDLSAAAGFRIGEGRWQVHIAPVAPEMRLPSLLPAVLPLCFMLLWLGFWLLRLRLHHNSLADHFRYLTAETDLVFWSRRSHDGRITFVNDRFQRVWGYGPEQLHRIPDLVRQTVHEEDLETYLSCLTQGGDGTAESRKGDIFRIIRPDGTWRWIRWCGQFASTTSRGRSETLTIVQDVTADQISANEIALGHTVLETMADGVVVINATEKIISVNRAFTEILGYGAEEVIGRHPSIITSTRHRPEHFDEIFESIERTGRWQGRMWNRHRSGEILPQSATVLPLPETGAFQAVRVMILGALLGPENKAGAGSLATHYDALTQLPNRILLQDRLKMDIARSARLGKKVALLFIDLDRFKPINDSFGHRTGDQLLIETAGRLSFCIGQGDTLARFGSDEFLISLPDVDGAREAEIVAQKILGVLSEPFRLEGDEFFLTASIGIALYPDDGDTADRLLQNADTAMDQAKEQGRNTLHFFTASLNAAAVEHMRIETLLRRAPERQEFTVYYQPLVEAQSGTIIGTEALLRWNAIELGSIAPDRFIPLAEDTGVIIPVGEWVLEMACRQTRLWQKQFGRPLRISVNVSSRQFRRDQLQKSVVRVLDATGLSPACLELEFTERLLVEDRPEIRDTITALETLGVRLAVDDFGTGYSALSYLKRFPVSSLKIDRSFVQDSTRDTEDRALIRAIIAMGHALNVEVIGEGVETHDQRRFLIDERCDSLQGFLFGCPVSAEAMAPLLEARVLQPRVRTEICQNLNNFVLDTKQ